MIEKTTVKPRGYEQPQTKTLLVSVRLPVDIVSEIDIRAEQEMRTRSNYVCKLFMDSWNRMHEVKYTPMRKNLNGCIVENVEN